MPQIPRTKRILSERKNRMHGAYTTCRATFVNGSRIGIRQITTVAVLPPIRRDRLKQNEAAEAERAAALVADFAVDSTVHLHRRLKIFKMVRRHPRSASATARSLKKTALALMVRAVFLHVAAGEVDLAGAPAPAARTAAAVAAVCKADLA